MRSDINNNSGNLASNLKSSVKRFSSGYELSISMPFYGAYVDSGTRGTDGSLGKKGGNTIDRKMPPISAIKLMNGANDGNVWAIAKHIQMFGTKAHPFIHNFEDVIIKYKVQIVEAIGSDVDNAVSKLFKQRQWQ